MQGNIVFFLNLFDLKVAAQEHTLDSHTVCMVEQTHMHTHTHIQLPAGSHTDLRDYKLSQNTKWYLAGLATGILC